MSMTFNVQVSADAEKHLQEIFHHIRFKYGSTETAARTVDGLETALQSLKMFPLRGRVYLTKYRAINYKRFTIVYEVDGQTVTIIAIH